MFDIRVKLLDEKFSIFFLVSSSNFNLLISIIIRQIRFENIFDFENKILKFYRNLKKKEIKLYKFFSQID